MSDHATDVRPQRDLTVERAAGSSVMSNEPGRISGTTVREMAPIATSGTASMTTSDTGTACAWSDTTTSRKLRF